MALRDRSLLLVGFAGALRRSELVALEVRDVVFSRHAGMVLTVRKAKTDQEGVGHQRGVPFGQNLATCPVRALEVWMAAAGIVQGRCFAPSIALGAWPSTRSRGTPWR